jgi:hypothetical protein
MTLSTIMLGIVLAGVGILIKISDDEFEAKRREFENS